MTNRRLTEGLVAVAIAVVALGWAAPSDARQAAGLPRWIEGCWGGPVGGERVHERWIVADGTTMIGVSHTLEGAALSAFEFLRIVVRSGAVVYLAQPGGRPPTEFTATSQSATEITFENPSHDFPKRVGYRRLDQTHLTAWIDGGTAGGGRRIEYPMSRQRCEP